MSVEHTAYSRATQPICEYVSSQSEAERVMARYWTFENGNVVPEWLARMVGQDVLWTYNERVFYRRTHCRWTKNWFYLGCAIELEHRASPITTFPELRRTVSRVLAPGYNFIAAEALDNDVRQLQEERITKIRESNRRHSDDERRRAALSQPGVVQLMCEIEAKQLPQSAIENLKLIRAIVGLQTENE